MKVTFSYMYKWSLLVCGMLLFLVPGTVHGLEKCTQVASEKPQNRKIVISDLHLGAGHQKGSTLWLALEDFRFSETFRKFLEQIGKSGNTDLIINGDFIDFWQILPELDENRKADLGSTEADSLAKLEIAIKEHRDTFADLRRFAETGKNRLIIVPGNHDVDLFWPQVQSRLQSELALKLNQKLFFTNSCYEADGVHVEHGHQNDEANRFKNANAPFETDGNVQRLQTNWGTVFMSRFYNRVEEQKPFIDNLTPEVAGIVWALENESPTKFSLPQIGRLIVMLTKDQKALAQLKLLLRTLGSEEPPKKVPEKTLDNLIKLYEGSDPELAKMLRTSVQDPEGRKEAEIALKEVTAEEWATLQTGFDKANPTETLENSILRIDPYIQESRRIVTRRPEISVVVMGHTHELDRAVVALDDVGAKDKWYVNTGCWQKILKVKDAKENRRWDRLNLDDPIFPLRFSYVLIDYQNDKPMRPAKSFWVE